LPSYPCFQQNPNSACAATPHFPARECTSYCDWRARQLGHFLPDWGNGGQWAGNAQVEGFIVNGRPEVDTVMALAPNTNGAGPQGHVAWVVAVEAQTVQVAEYNFLVKYGYDERDARIAGAQFIHLGIPPPPAPPTGDSDVPPMYQRTNGSTYLLSGGTLITMGDAADIQYNLSLGSKIILESKITAAYAASLNKLPVI
jgi:surface antigen